jgi:hypothetical protein
MKHAGDNDCRLKATIRSVICEAAIPMPLGCLLEDVMMELHDLPLTYDDFYGHVLEMEQDGELTAIYDGDCLMEVAAPAVSEA